MRMACGGGWGRYGTCVLWNALWHAPWHVLWMLGHALYGTCYGTRYGMCYVLWDVLWARARAWPKSSVLVCMKVRVSADTRVLICRYLMSLP